MATDKSTSAEQRLVERVKTLRKERGWTQGELAERMVRVGLDYASQSTVSRLEQGGRPIRLIEAQALARIFGSTIWQLTADEPRVEMLAFADLNLTSFIRDRMAYRESLDKLTASIPVMMQTLDQLNQDFPVGDVSLSPDASERVEHLRNNIKRQLDQAHADLRKGNNPFFRAHGDSEHEVGTKAQ